mmetsp:Transcript_21145/g.50287  ORF Transcript_21145/g.50287 Transcript_21145/m.50287 type:complete len:250 (-) Transcript_21145:200-949(-)
MNPLPSRPSMASLTFAVLLRAGFNMGYGLSFAKVSSSSCQTEKTSRASKMAWTMRSLLRCCGGLRWMRPSATGSVFCGKGVLLLRSGLPSTEVATRHAPTAPWESLRPLCTFPRTARALLVSAKLCWLGPLKQSATPGRHAFGMPASFPWRPHCLSCNNSYRHTAWKTRRPRSTSMTSSLMSGFAVAVWLLLGTARVRTKAPHLLVLAVVLSLGRATFSTSSLRLQGQFKTPTVQNFVLSFVLLGGLLA